MKRNAAIKFVSFGFAAFIAALWGFPLVWYSRSGSDHFSWFEDRTNIVEWTFVPMPVSKAEEAALTADVTFAGAFTNRFESVHVFSARRFSERQNEIGLFVHTPDRCWTESGWKLGPTDPDFIAVNLHGSGIKLERRIFVWKDKRQYLVYFGGLSSGEPLPYRLDHNLSVGQRQQVSPDSSAIGLKSRVVNPQLWGHVWEVFRARRKVAGPKQFFRISTEISGSNVKAADARLQALLPRWLVLGDFQTERQSFQNAQLTSAKDTKARETHGGGH